MLSIVIVTKGEDCIKPYLEQTRGLAELLKAELVIGADACKNGLDNYTDKIVPVISDGYLESVLDEVIKSASGKWVLRLDDDETASPALVEWLKAERYTASDVWAFPRANLWRGMAITKPPLWPDIQTRLSIKRKAGGRKQIHQGSPWGTGVVAPVAIFHHKFTVRSFQDRLRIAATYESVKPGCGFGDTYQPYNLPERSFKSFRVMDIGSGAVPDWRGIVGRGEEVTLDS